MSKSVVESISRLLRRVPGKAWLAVGGLLVGAFWLQQHDARIRQQARLQQLRNETSTQVAALRRQAAREVKQANVENAKAIAELEQRRQQAERQNRQLAAQLTRLRRQAQIQADEVATLPISEIVTRVAAQLGLKAGDIAGKEEASSRQGAKAQRELQVTNYELQMPGAATAPGHERASSRQGARAESTAETHTSHSVRSRTAGRHPAAAPAEGGGRGALGAPAGGQSPPLQDTVVLPLTSSGARKVEKSLVALNACHAENNIETQQISTCQARAEADEAEVKRLQSSVSSLNQALAAKDQILARKQSECEAELRAARGTFLGRLARTAEHVAIGVAMGVAIGVAVK